MLRLSSGDGLLPEGGLYWTLAGRIRAGRAREAMLTGRVFSAEDALESGLVNLVTDPGQALEKALEVAARYAAMPAEVVAWLKVAMATGSDTLEQAIETETNVQPLLRLTEDHLSAVQDFREKRRHRRHAPAGIVPDLAAPRPSLRVNSHGRVAILTIDNPGPTECAGTPFATRTQPCHQARDGGRDGGCSRTYGRGRTFQRRSGYLGDA